MPVEHASCPRQQVQIPSYSTINFDGCDGTDGSAGTSVPAPKIQEQRPRSTNPSAQVKEGTYTRSVTGTSGPLSVQEICDTKPQVTKIRDDCQQENGIVLIRLLPCTRSPGENSTDVMAQKAVPGLVSTAPKIQEQRSRSTNPSAQVKEGTHTRSASVRDQWSTVGPRNLRHEAPGDQNPRRLPARERDSPNQTPPLHPQSRCK